MRRINQRQDFLSKKKYPKSELLRFVEAGGLVRLDRQQNVLGRGVYLREDSLASALEQHAFTRAFGHKVTKEEEDAIKKTYEQCQKR
jgi:predicted RNA-binding protein YlxR (DUF448 family)